MSVRNVPMVDAHYLWTCDFCGRTIASISNQSRLPSDWAAIPTRHKCGGCHVCDKCCDDIVKPYVGKTIEPQPYAKETP